MKLADAHDAIERVRGRKTSCIELARDALDRLAAAEPLNAYIRVEADALLEGASNLDERRAGQPALPLRGVILAVKDNMDVAGWPLTAASPVYSGLVSTTTASCVRALTDAGAMIVGKTNLHELAYGVLSDSVAHGAVRNAFAPDRSAGGSSGGNAVALATGSCMLAVGSDTGGSLRIPAGLCGVVGFRPSPGRYGGDGVVPISPSRDVPGPMARSVRDIRLFDRIVTGRAATEPQSTPVRLGLPRHWFLEELSDDVRSLFERSCTTLERNGCTLVPVDLGGAPELVDRSSLAVMQVETLPALCNDLARRGRPLSAPQIIEQVASPDVRWHLAAAEEADTVAARAAYDAAMRLHRPALRALVESRLRELDLDALCFPTTPITAPHFAAPEAGVGGQLELFGQLIRNTQLASLADMPSISLPMGRTPSGLPAGLQLDGVPGQDDRLLEVAARVEAMLARV